MDGRTPTRQLALVGVSCWSAQDLGVEQRVSAFGGRSGRCATGPWYGEPVVLGGRATAGARSLTQSVVRRPSSKFQVPSPWSVVVLRGGAPWWSVVHNVVETARKRPVPMPLSPAPGCGSAAARPIPRPSAQPAQLSRTEQCSLSTRQQPSRRPIQAPGHPSRPCRGQSGQRGADAGRIRRRNGLASSSTPPYTSRGRPHRPSSSSAAPSLHHMPHIPSYLRRASIPSSCTPMCLQTASDKSLRFAQPSSSLPPGL
jgi:hypothetical protein